MIVAAPHPAARALSDALAPWGARTDVVIVVVAPGMPTGADWAQLTGPVDEVSFVPVLAAGAWEDHAPDELRYATPFDLRDGQDCADGEALRELLRSL